MSDIPDHIRHHKIASQCGHAFKILTRNLRSNPELDNAYFSDGIGTNIVLKARNQFQIERAYQAALEAGLPCALITDENHIIPNTAFDGREIITAIGIGPCLRHEIHHITKRF